MSLASQYASSQTISSRRDFVAYTLGLMRAHSNEHRDLLPPIDIASLRHVAYVLDAFLFYMQPIGGNLSTNTDSDSDEYEEYDETTPNEKPTPIRKSQRSSSFFRRSNSTLCLGARAPDPFACSMSAALPLAARPHLLQPDARMYEMFRVRANHSAHFAALRQTGLMDSSLRASFPQFTLNLASVKTANNKRKLRDGEFMLKFEKNLGENLDAGDRDELMNRWRVSVDLMGRVFGECVGAEPGSLLATLAGFQLKEIRFRRDMERLKNLSASSRELAIGEVERVREKLIHSAFKALNMTYYVQCTRRMAMHQHHGGGAVSVMYPPPLCMSRVKVTFKDEQGEGSGVARSFYTCLAEAILADAPMPTTLDAALVTTSTAVSSILPSNTSPQYIPFTMHRYRNASASALSSIGSTRSGGIYSPANIQSSTIASAATATTAAADGTSSTRARSISSLIPASVTAANSFVTIRPSLRSLNQSPTTSSVSSTSDSAPLFWQPDKTAGCYAPRAGRQSAARLNAFRNVGRLIATCLLQNELCPIPLCRHVIKYILGREVRWHDLAFYDPHMYESLRQMVHDAEQMLRERLAERASLAEAMRECDERMFEPLELTFSVDVPPEEGVDGATGATHDLLPNGASMNVTSANMYEFVRLYSHFRLVGQVDACLSQIRAGVHDVLPASSLEALTAEDFRLLLNGVDEVSIHVLSAYTTVSDESKEPGRRPQFEKWFWTVLERMAPQEKQEMLFFWTGSGRLPASDEGFQPLPTITLRPASEHHLPTANTCINRLYLPMYTSKSVLKVKLLQAIKTKTFGFV